MSYAQRMNKLNRARGFHRSRKPEISKRVVTYPAQSATLDALYRGVLQMSKVKLSFETVPVKIAKKAAEAEGKPKRAAETAKVRRASVKH